MTKLGPRMMDIAVRFTRPAAATKLLHTVLTDHPPSWMTGSEGRLRVQAATVLREHAGSRLVLRYVICWSGQERSLIAKFYARDRSDVARTLSSLAARGLGPGQPMQVSTLVGYVSGIDLLLMEEAPGQTARAALRRGQSGIGERTAQWLAALHAAAIPVPPTYVLRDPLSRARRWARRLGVNAPELGVETRRLLTALIDAPPAWPPQPRLTHGDFSISHVYVAPETTTVIDWDSWAAGDCAEDAGRFMASLHHLCARDPAHYVCAHKAAQSFAQTYLALVPMAGQNFAFYEALACLRTATRVSGKQLLHRIRHAQAMLAAGTLALTRVSKSA